MSSAFILAAVVVGQPAPDAADGFVAVSPAAVRPVGRLTKLTPDFVAELASANGATAVADVFSLRRVGVALPPLPRGAGLLTTTGDRVPGRVISGDDAALHFQPTATRAAWSVPLPAVAVAWLGTPPADTPPDPDRVAWLGPNRKRDVLRLRNGDIARGTIDGFMPDGEGVRFKPDAGEERAVPLAAVNAVAFNPALSSARRPKGAYAHAVLRDGTRLFLTTPTADETTLRGKTLFGPAVELPLAAVVAIDVIRGKATDLAQLKPKVESGGYLGVTWPWAPDRTVRGDPLRLVTANGVETFDRGLGTHPRTVLTYELVGKYRRFEALVGLDPVTARSGRAAVRVAVDGKDQPVIDLAPGVAVPVSAEIAGAKSLTLAVEYGPAGDVQADVNWCDARLIE